MEPKKEDVFVHEFDKGLLREVECPEGLVIHEASHTVDGLELVLSLIGNVLAGNKS